MNRTTNLFNFIRGAVKAAYGIEDFRPLTFLLVGESELNHSLLNCLCSDEVVVKFKENNLSGYHRAFSTCRQIDVYRGGPIDVTIDFDRQEVTIRGKSFPLNKLSGNTYTQGIHEYYLVKDVKPNSRTRTKRRFSRRHQRDS